MLSLPKELAPEMIKRKEDMLRFLAEQYGTMNFGPGFGHIFGFIVGVVFALLLLSAVNTAIAALIGLLFMMSREGDMPGRLPSSTPMAFRWLRWESRLFSRSSSCWPPITLRLWPVFMPSAWSVRFASIWDPVPSTGISR